VIVKQENGDGTTEDYSVNRKGLLLDIPMVILVNKGSASASEILAGALRYYQRGKIVGETTFGKGTIQEAVELDQGAGLHVTTAKWLLPDGTWLKNNQGLEPDIKVENPKDDETKDLQLLKAAELINNK
jgi:carboxyl-terminal processing protease